MKTERSTVFICYTRKNEKWFNLVQKNLKVLESLRSNVDIWSDLKIRPGMKWKLEIKKALKMAKVAVLLISTDFLVSDFISKYELPSFLKAAKKEGAIILPLILEDCMFNDFKDLSQFQAINDPEKPLQALPKPKRDKEILKLVRRIKDIFSEIKTVKKPSFKRKRKI